MNSTNDNFYSWVVKKTDHIIIGIAYIYILNMITGQHNTNKQSARKSFISLKNREI